MEEAVDPRVTQCIKNCDAWLQSRLIKPAGILDARTDRCFYRTDVSILWQLEELRSLLLLESGNFRNHGPTAVRGYREAVGRGSAQIVVHKDETGYSIEVDFDYWNPWDVVGLVGHWWEVAANKFTRKKTNPERVAKLLRKRGFDV